MKRTALLCLFLLSISSRCFSARADFVDLKAKGPERIVFHTVAGDLVFALYPNLAPRTVQQFLKLVRAGVYDTTAFSRLHPNFIAQISTAQDRLTALTPQQSALIQALPLETGPQPIPHGRGLLSLAHKDGEPDSGETSFCIMLGPAPQLDGKYTVFGTLEKGDDVLNELLKVPRNEQFIPAVRLTVLKADVFDSAESYGHANLAPTHEVPGAQALTQSESGPRRGLLAAGILLMITLAAVAGLLRQHLPPPLVTSLNLIVVLVGAFLLFSILMPEGQHKPLLAAALFFGLILVFRALGKFETVER